MKASAKRQTFDWAVPGVAHNAGLSPDLLQVVLNSRTPTWSTVWGIQLPLKVRLQRLPNQVLTRLSIA